MADMTTISHKIVYEIAVQKKIGQSKTCQEEHYEVWDFPGRKFQPQAMPIAWVSVIVTGI